MLCWRSTPPAAIPGVTPCHGWGWGPAAAASTAAAEALTLSLRPLLQYGVLGMGRISVWEKIRLAVLAVTVSSQAQRCQRE